jgi:serine/threonine protein kinase
VSGEDWDAAAKLFEKALRETPAARRAILMESGANEDVQHEVLRLLENADQAEREDFLDEIPGAVKALYEEDEQRYEVGDQIAERFRVREFLGRGGIAEVYGCIDELQGGEFAIKTIRLDTDLRNWAERQLKREVQLAGRLAHRNICRVYELHVDVAGHELYLSMEWLKGETLASRIARQVLELEEILEIASGIAAAMDSAHPLGILHRDLKSANVMLCRDEGRMGVVMDFGLARATPDQARAATAGSTVIQSGMVAGTLAYMSPEQLAGKRACVASDVYAFGVMLYEMACRELPFSGQTAFQHAEERLKGKMVRPRVLRPEVPRSWERAIHDCLELEPGRRPKLCGDVVERLRVGLRGGWSAQWGFSSQKSRRRFVQAAVGVGLVGSCGAYGYREWEAKQPTRMSPAAAAALKRGQEVAKQRTEEGIRAAIEELDQASRLAPDAPEIWNSLAETHLIAINFMFSDPRQARVAAEQAVERSLALRPRQARILGIQGVLRAYDFQRWREAEGFFKKAMAMDEADAQVHNWYGNFLGRARRGEEALVQIRRALELDPASQAYNHQLGVQLLRMKRYEDYEAHCREMVRLHPTEAANHLALARALLFTGKLSEARVHTAEAGKLKYSILARCLEAEIAVMEGKLEQGWNEAKQIEKHWRESRMETLLLLYLYARLDAGEKVVELAREGMRRGDATVLAMPASPYFEKFQSKPEYRQLLGELGF